MTKSATQKLAELRAQQAALADQERALLDARLDEIAVIVDRAGGGILPDEMVAGCILLAVNGNDEMKARLHESGSTFLGVRRRRGVQSGAISAPPEARPAPAKSADLVVAETHPPAAEPDAPGARQDGAEDGGKEAKNG